MVTGRTRTGFEFSVHEDALADWDVLDAIADTQSGTEADKVLACVKIARAVCGKDYERLKAHCRNSEGRITFQAMEAEIGDIFAAIREGQQGKNS